MELNYINRTMEYIFVDFYTVLIDKCEDDSKEYFTYFFKKLTKEIVDGANANVSLNYAPNYHEYKTKILETKTKTQNAKIYFFKFFETLETKFSDKLCDNLIKLPGPFNIPQCTKQPKNKGLSAMPTIINKGLVDPVPDADIHKFDHPYAPPKYASLDKAFECKEDSAQEIENLQKTNIDINKMLEDSIVKPSIIEEDNPSHPSLF